MIQKITPFAVLFVIIIKLCASRVLINRYDDECSSLIHLELINEIESYRNVTEFIMKSVKNGSGQQMYKTYSNFIDKFGARLSGSEVLEQSIDFMINLTTSNGLNDVTTENVEVPFWQRGEEEAYLIKPRSKKLAILGLGYSVATPQHGITAEAIVVKSFEDLDKIANESVAGKIVVFNPNFISYGDTVVYRSQGASKAAAKGAAATLIRSITPFSLYTPHTGAQFYADNVPKIPTACITVEDADLLERLQHNGEKLTIFMKMLSTSDWNYSRNTLIDLKGRQYPDKFVIVSGHIDSWDVGQGAMDDGGGMFISWYAPVLLHQLGIKPRRTLRAILWTGEEMGLIGAQAYLSKHKGDLDKINFIMESDEGTFKPLGLEVSGSKRGLCVIAQILKLFTPIDKLEASDAPGSDIVLFIRQGVPGASLLNKNEKYFLYHHTEADTMDVQNMDDVVHCAAFWAAVSYVIADLSDDIPRT